MTRPKPLLYRRGFYLALGGFVALLYGFLWVKQLDKPAGWKPPTAWSAPEVDASALTLNAEKLLETLRRDQGLARLVNLWGLVALLLLAGGLILSAQALARGTVWRVLRTRESHLPGESLRPPRSRHHPQPSRRPSRLAKYLPHPQAMLAVRIPRTARCQKSKTRTTTSSPC